MPEGVEVDAEAAAGLKDLAKELGLTQDQAQKFADLGSKMAAAQLAKQAVTIEQWGKDAAVDKEFGGEKLQENLAIAKGAMSKLAPGLAPVLESTGLGNHPEIIRAFWRAGLMMADDKVVTPGNPGNGNAGKSLADILYPSK
jgi:hypothetical protein